MTSDLTTTNILLGILAAVSVLEALAIVGLCVGATLLVRRIQQAIAGIESRQIAPVSARVNAILDDVKTVTSTVKQETEHLTGLWRRVTGFAGRYRAS